MSPTKLNMLKRLGQFARNEDSFTTNAPGWVAMTQVTVSKYLRELFDAGLIIKVRAGYRITERGRAMVDGPGASTQPTRITNAGVKETYVPPPWNIRAGAGELSKNGRCA